MNDSTKVHLLASFRARPGRGDELARLLEGLVAPTHAEPGCERYELWRDEADPREFVFVEVWSSQAELDAHAASAHLAAAAERFAELVERGPELRHCRHVA